MPGLLELVLIQPGGVLPPGVSGRDGGKGYQTVIFCRGAGLR